MRNKRHQARKTKYRDHRQEPAEHTSRAPRGTATVPCAASPAAHCRRVPAGQPLLEFAHIGKHRIAQTPGTRRTGSPRAFSQRFTVRSSLPKKLAISFQLLSRPSAPALWSCGSVVVTKCPDMPRYAFWSVFPALTSVFNAAFSGWRAAEFLGTTELMDARKSSSATSGPQHADGIRLRACHLCTWSFGHSSRFRHRPLSWRAQWPRSPSRIGSLPASMESPSRRWLGNEQPLTAVAWRRQGRR